MHAFTLSRFCSSKGQKENLAWISSDIQISEYFSKPAQQPGDVVSQRPLTLMSYEGDRNSISTEKQDWLLVMPHVAAAARGGTVSPTVKDSIVPCQEKPSPILPVHKTSQVLFLPPREEESATEECGYSFLCPTNTEY
ncbi:UNVERIFIED_CONTAM: hypothetical protein FKN15_025994 [Acipenser sinensis]